MTKQTKWNPKIWRTIKRKLPFFGSLKWKRKGDRTGKWIESGVWLVLVIQMREMTFADKGSCRRWLLELWTFRDPSLPFAGVTGTLACSWRVGRRCTWCGWSTEWPACSSCASRASPAPCERRKTWGSWTCPRCSALMSPVLSYPPSRCVDPRWTAWGGSCFTGLVALGTCKNADMFSLEWAAVLQPFPLFVLAPNPWPQQHPGLCQLSHSWKWEAPLHHEEGRGQPRGRRTLLHALPRIFRRTGAYSQREAHQ